MSGISLDQEQQLKELVAKGNKIAAIARYREITGVGLKQAKDAVEAIMGGASVNLPPPSQASEPDPFLENRIKRLLTEQKKIEAVKVYREAHHCGLKEAKDAVDFIQVEMRREGYSSLSSASAVSDDPFGEETQRNHRILMLVFAILLVAAGALVFLFMLR